VLVQPERVVDMQAEVVKRGLLSIPCKVVWWRKEGDGEKLSDAQVVLNVALATTGWAHNVRLHVTSCPSP